MLSTSQSNDEYENITIQIGEEIKYYNAKGEITTGEVLAGDPLLGKIKVLSGHLIKLEELIDIDDLIY